MIERDILFESDGLSLAGVLRHPGCHMAPGVLLIHGSMEHDRDGNLLRNHSSRPLYKKSFFLEISQKLCNSGFATFSWDRRGWGESEGGYEDVFTAAKDSLHALDALCSQPDIDKRRVAVFGQSAGVYTACLLAEQDARPKAFIVSGGLYRSYREMMAFNYHRVVDYANRSPECLFWVEQNDLTSLIIGLNLDLIERGALQRRRKHLLTYKEHKLEFFHDPSCYFENLAPSRQFHLLKKPVLIIHGACDLNVPVEDAGLIKEELMRNGNYDIELAIISGADHCFKLVPHDDELRLKERMSLQSFRNPYCEQYFQALVEFLKRRL